MNHTCHRPWSWDQRPKPPEAENLSAFGCQTEAANLLHSPYFANWRVKLQTWQTLLARYLYCKKSPDCTSLRNNL